MYERSIVVLEKYMDKILEFDKKYNLKKNNEDYINLVSEIDNFQILEEKDIKIIQEFDDTVRRIEHIQKEQQKIFKNNKTLEETRAQLFSELGEDAKSLENKIKKVEENLDKNNERLKKLREQFISNLNNFSKKQKDRNKCDKERRVSEEKYIDYIKDAHEEFGNIDVKDIATLKDFINSGKEQIKEEILKIMIKNGTNERIPFNQDVLKKAISNRVDIAEKEVECYILVYDKMKKLLEITDNENIKLDKYKQTVRDVSIKLAFLNAQKGYIVEFLDYERMTTISGAKAHKKMMIDACNNFELDMMQIRKLYELILKEIANKATKSDYDELYNKNYLKNIEDKQKNFEKEANNVDVAMGTLINSNYWRIDGIKNIYTVFQKEILEKFNRDLSGYETKELENKNNEYNSKLKNEYYDGEEDYENIDIDNKYDDDENYYNYHKYYYDEEDDSDEDDQYSNGIYDDYYDDEKVNIDDIDELIKDSRKKGLQEERRANRKENKGLFNKFFSK